MATTHTTTPVDPVAASPRVMKALSICQPYAWGIVNGHKRIENRSWKTHFRGRLAIHAGLSLDWMVPRLDCGVAVPKDLDFGYVVGAVTVVDCVPVDHPSVMGNPYAHGPWCWVLADPKVLRVPVKYRGQQGLFDLPIDAILDAQEKAFTRAGQRPLTTSGNLFDARAS